MKKSLRGLPIVMLVLVLSLSFSARGLAAEEETFAGAGKPEAAAEQPEDSPRNL